MCFEYESKHDESVKANKRKVNPNRILRKTSLNLRCHYKLELEPVRYIFALSDFQALYLMLYDFLTPTTRDELNELFPCFSCLLDVELFGRILLSIVSLAV